MSTQPKPFVTEEQYLEIEERSERRSEYFRGEIFPMEATTVPHATIHSNLGSALLRELAGSGCRLFFGQLRVRVSRTGLYTYPDLVIVCGKPELSEKDPNSVTNPKVIVEILSPSTEDYDRGSKFDQYRSIPSFVEYLVVVQDRIYAGHWVKQPDGGWLLHDLSDGDATVFLSSIGVRFPMSEVYAGVELELRQPA